MVKDDEQRVRAYVKGELLEERTLTAGDDLSLTIPEEMLEDGSVAIRLEYPDAASSAEDSRVLALAIVSMTLDRAD